MPQTALAGLDPATLFAPIAHEESIGLAVSGGADSLALMVLYALWAPAHGKPRAIVYTLDHRLRPEARADAEMVLRQAERFGFQARLLTWEGAKPDTGRQAAARQARYRLIGAAMGKDGARALLTAHHLGDQAETVLMRMAHGSGMSGLGGMRLFAEVEGVRVFRPLLSVPRQTLATIAVRSGLAPVHDPSNFSADYERTRWRNALPELSALGLTEQRLGQVARRAQRIDDLAECATIGFLQASAAVDPLGVVHLDLPALLAAQAEVSIRSLGRAIALVSGGRREQLGPLEALHAALCSGEDMTRTLSGAVLRARGKQLLVYREMRFPPPSLDVAAGERALWNGRFTIIAGATPVTVATAQDMTRDGFSRRVGHRLAVPVAALRAAPLVRDPSGSVVAVGEHVLVPGLSVCASKLTA